MSTDNNQTPANDWPQPKHFRKSIRFEFSLYLCGIILLLMLTSGYIITEKYVNTVTNGIIDRLLAQSQSYSGSAGKLIISTNGPDALLLNNLCNKLAADNPDIFWVGISDRNESFLAHTDFKKVIQSEKMKMPNGFNSEKILAEKKSLEIYNDTLKLIIPIVENNTPVGYLGLASSTKQIKEARTSTILTIAMITLIMLLIGIPATMIVLNRKLRPIQIITSGLKAISFDNINLEFPMTSKNELGYLAETLKVMGKKLNLAQKDLIEQERISRELEIAREIQANILPKDYPSGNKFQFAGIYQSAREVGGDYYDFIEYDNNYIGFIVADVSGKSLPGMLMMLITRDIVKKLAHIYQNPAELLSAVNRELLTNIKKGMFVTLFYGLLNKNNGHFSYASAGHNPLIRINGNNGECELIKTKGFPLGLMPEDAFSKRIECGEIILGSNDWLIQFTDGINEAMNDEQEEFGMDRFLSILKDNRELRPEAMITKTIEKHQAFIGKAPQFDDITLLVMKWNMLSADIKYEKERVLNYGN